MMTWTTCVAPAWTKPVLGLTQYFLGAVVFTLKAISEAPGLYRRIVVGICFLSSTGNRRVRRETGASAKEGDRGARAAAVSDARAGTKRDPGGPRARGAGGADRARGARGGRRRGSGTHSET